VCCRSNTLAICAAAFATACAPANDLPVSPAPAALAFARSTEAQPASSVDEIQVQDAPEATPVVVVVLDGVRWQEVFEGVDPALAASHHTGPVVGARGLLPSLYAALETRGAALGAPGHGDAIAASGPNFVSLPGYTEIFGGRAPDGCADNRCAGATGPTIVDAFRDRAARDSDVAVITSWERIGRAATRSPARIVLSAGRQEITGARFLVDDPGTRDALGQGAQANPRPGHDEFRPDRYTAALALRYLEAKRPDFLFVGLGEPDEYAHADDYAGYVSSLRAADDFFGELFAALDRMGERGRRSLVLVTADHGRARDYRYHGAGLPESARVWLLAMGGPVRARGFVSAPQARRLADVAPTIRQAVGLPPDDTARAGTPMAELFEETVAPWL
jgi:hypothetical protein